MDMPKVLAVETNTCLVIHTLGARDLVQDFKMKSAFDHFLR